MGSIYLIRHGQASWDSDDYDQLSALGERQAYALGKHWASRVPPCQTIAGTMLRHRQTAEGFQHGLAQNHPIAFMSGFNEFDHEEVIYRYRPEWRDMSKMRRFFETQPKPDHAFSTHFAAAMLRWVGADYDDYSESFSAFKRRCITTLKTVAEGTFNATDTGQIHRNVAVFTSGGVISMICAELMGLSNEQSLLLNSRIVNSSVTKVVFRKNAVLGPELTVDSINNYSHLEPLGSEWITRK